MIKILFIFVVVYLASPGYNITFNATEYEFDVNVFSPVETVLFDVLLLAENLSDILKPVYSFDIGNNANIDDPFGINQIQMSASVILKRVLDPNDDRIDYNFNINFGVTILPNEATHDTVYTGSVSVILHEIGKL